MGYAGGTTPAPTYRELGDHSEVVQVDFDPRAISYRELLALFWRSHDPCGEPWSRQYRSAILVASETQREEAEASRRAQATLEGRPIATAIEDLATFTLAEDYHQKYRLRRLPTVAAELEAMYPRLEDLVRSTAATRANALAGGALRRADLERLAPDLGLSEAALAELSRAVR